VWCLKSSMFDIGNLTCRQIAITFIKIRISKSEIRNNIKIQMFEIQNKCGLVLFLSVFVIEISVI